MYTNLQALEDVETDGRRAVVSFGESFEEDLRRDLVLTLCTKMLRESLRLPEGQEDLKNKRIRFVGDAELGLRRLP